MTIDLRTLYFSYLLTDVVCLLVMIFLWQQIKKQYRGSGYLVIDFALQVSALFLIAARGIIPDWISINVANTLAMLGAVLGLMGLEKLLNKRSNHLHNYIIVVIFTVIHFYFTFVQPNLAIRNLNTSITFSIFSLQYVWLMWKRVPRYNRDTTFNIGLIFSAYVVVNLLRIIEFFVSSHHETDYFKTGNFEAFAMLSYQILYLFFTYALALLLNKKLLLANKLQEEKFLKAFHASSSGIIISRLVDGHIFEVNNGFCAISGYKTNEAIDKTTIGLRFWDDENDRKIVLQHLKEKGKFEEAEFRFRKKNGELFWGIIHSEIITIDGEECVISNIIDISSRKAIEEELIKSEQLNKTLLQTIPFGMDIVDQQGNILFMNDKLLSIFGEEAIGRKCWSLYRDEKSQCPDCPLHREIEIGKTETYESHNTLVGNILEVNHTGMMFQGKKAILEIFQVITDRKNAEAQLKKYADELKLANETKNKLFSIIGHDLRSPFTTITGFSEMIRDEVENLDKKTIRDYANILHSSAIYTQNLFQNLLEWARVQQGQITFNPETIHLNLVVDEIVDLLSGTAEKKGIIIKSIVPPALLVQADANMLKTVIRNLVSNALKYTPHGGAIKIEASKTGIGTTVYVQDNGTGIDQEILATLFDSNSNQSLPGTDNEKGTGLGLHLCREFIELHGGKIWAESSVGKGNTGSKFIFTLPKQLMR